MKRALITFAIGIIGFVLMPTDARAAVLSPVTSDATVELNRAVTVELTMNSEQQEINAVEATLTYAPDVVKVIDIAKGGSFLSLWAEEPVVTTPGIIHFVAGIPEGSIVFGGQTLTITFQALSLGRTVIAVDQNRSGVYLNDGKGTKTTLSTTDLIFDVVPPHPFAPQLISPSHPNEVQWSRNDTFIVQWTVRPSTVVSYALSRDPLVEPDDVVEDNNGITSFPALEDGMWYFSFRERLSGEDWGPLYRRQVRVDTTSPDPFTVGVSYDSASSHYLVSFSTTDRTSGVDEYRVRIERTRWWKPWRTTIEEQRASGVMSLTDMRNVKRITVRAFDNAGNEQDATWVSSATINGTRWLLLADLFAVMLFGIVLLRLIRHIHIPRSTSMQ